VEKLFLIRYGELALKGQNRSYFENKLIENLKENLKGEDVNIEKDYGRVFVYCRKEDEQVVQKKLLKVFGIVGISKVVKVNLDLDEIKSVALRILKEREARTFKVETRRINKSFPYRSMDLNNIVGGYILKNVPNIKVNVHEPELMLNIEIRDKAYLYTENFSGPGGLPYGISGKGMLLLSGGIDSPVAGFMMMKRGLELEGVHFYSYPFTSERAKEKVIDLCKLLSDYSNGIFRLNIVHFTDIQKEIYEKCPERLMTVIMRRFMVRIAEGLALRKGAKCLVTGESLGQVASQTLENLNATNKVAGLPVFRPLIGMDKLEIIEIAKRIGTYEISIRPYEDCCTVFLPKHPATKANLEALKRAEEVLDVGKMVQTCLEKDVEELEVGN